LLSFIAPNKGGTSFFGMWQYFNDMKRKRSRPDHEPARPDAGKPEIRKDLQDASKGKDLSYLNEMPQMAGYEGVKAGVPPPKKNAANDEENTMADES
jgi:hypothetical protein